MSRQSINKYLRAVREKIVEFCEEENPQRGEIECTRKVLRGKEGARKKRAWSKRERYCFWTLKARWKSVYKNRE